MIMKMLEQIAVSACTRMSTHIFLHLYSRTSHIRAVWDQGVPVTMKQTIHQICIAMRIENMLYITTALVKLSILKPSIIHF